MSRMFSKKNTGETSGFKGLTAIAREKETSDQSVPRSTVVQSEQPGAEYSPLSPAIPGGTPADERLASAMLIGSFLVRKGGTLYLESSSAYGAAILIPQLARTAGWPWFLTSEVLRSWLFLFLNIGIQFCLLRLIGKEESVMDLYSGQMYLCDFADGVRGPLGTEITPARTYPFDQWITRLFVKDSLKAIFPHEADRIETLVDPGEYALESFSARWVCCFIFMLATMTELLMIINMLRLLLSVPSAAQPWVERKPPEAEEHPLTWLDGVRIKIAGIPPGWKVVYLLLVWVPKVLIWKLTCQIGIDFLMETSCIEDIIVNSVAMAFILNIDEMICGTLMTDPAKSMLARCEEYPLYNIHEEASHSEEDIIAKYYDKQCIRQMRCADVFSSIPWKFIGCSALTALFCWDYYMRHCDTTKDGVLVSKPIYTPEDTDFNFLTLLMPNTFPPERSDQLAWHFRGD